MSGLRSKSMRCIRSYWRSSRWVRISTLHKGQALQLQLLLKMVMYLLSKDVAFDALFAEEVETVFDDAWLYSSVLTNRAF